MTPQEWWRAVKDAGIDATTTKVLYALSIRHIGEDGIIKRPPPTFKQLAKETGLSANDVREAIRNALRLGWLIKAGFTPSSDWLNVLCAVAVGDKNG
jgi:hypothetical protein